MKELNNLKKLIEVNDANDRLVIDALNKFSDKLDSLSSRVQMLEDKMK